MKTIVLVPGVAVCSLLMMIASGCSNNTSISHSYVDPVLRKLDLEGVLVVAIARDPAAQKDFELAFSHALGRHGVQAVASHTLVQKAKPSAEDIIAAAEAAGLDTIMVTRYIGQSTEDVYHPGTIYYGVAPAYGAGYYGGFGGYYGRAYEIAYDQPVWTSNVSHTLVSDLYVTETQGHIWQAVSETIQASGDRKLRNDAIDGLIKNLKDQGMLD